MSGMRKAMLALAIFFLIALLTGIPAIVKGVASRGFGGLNYGRVIFPLLLSGVCFHLYTKK